MSTKNHSIGSKEMCKFGDKCKFGKKCKNLHPTKNDSCKFGSSCRDILNCKFIHTEEEKNLAEFENLVSSWAFAFDNWKKSNEGSEKEFALFCYPTSSSEELDMIVCWIQNGAKLQEFECPFSDYEEDEEEKFLLECERDFL